MPTQRKCLPTLPSNLELAQQIYAGCDIFPYAFSLRNHVVSPQMMSMRYGTLPVVMRLVVFDTVEPYNPCDRLRYRLYIW